jgi:hypothetical protein
MPMLPRSPGSTRLIPLSVEFGLDFLVLEAFWFHLDHISFLFFLFPRLKLYGIENTKREQVAWVPLLVITP